MTLDRDTPLSTAEARDNFAEVLNRAAYGKERVVLARRGKPLVAVVPIEDVQALEAMEDERDMALIRKRLAAWERRGRKSTPLEKIARRYRVKR